MHSFEQSPEINTISCQFNSYFRASADPIVTARPVTRV